MYEMYTSVPAKRDLRDRNLHFYDITRSREIYSDNGIVKYYAELFLKPRAARNARPLVLETLATFAD